MAQKSLKKQTLNQRAGVDEEPEEGEVKVYDDQAYLVTDGELFNFETTKNASINWRQVNEFTNFMQENQILPTHTIDAAAVAENHILNNLDSLAHCDFSNDRNGQWLSMEGQQVLKAAQCGMQYYMFAQKHLTKKVMTLNDYLTQQTLEVQRLKQIKSQH